MDEVMSCTHSRRIFLRVALVASWLAIRHAQAAQETSILHESVTYAGSESSIGGFLARPILSDGAGVLLIHDRSGLTSYIKGVAGKLAEAGYSVLAPDLYSRLGIAEQLTAMTSPLPTPSAGQIISDLESSLAYLEHQIKGDGIRTRFAILGFGWGGEQAFLYATENSELNGAISFDGPTPEPVERLNQLTVPLLGNYAEDDPFVRQTLADVQTALTKAGKTYDFKIFPGTKPDFYESGSANFNQVAADGAWERAWAFLAKSLKVEG